MVECYARDFINFFKQFITEKAGDQGKIKSNKYFTVQPYYLPCTARMFINTCTCTIEFGVIVNLSNGMLVYISIDV